MDSQLLQRFLSEKIPNMNSGRTMISLPNIALDDSEKEYVVSTMKLPIKIIKYSIEVSKNDRTRLPSPVSF